MSYIIIPGRRTQPFGTPVRPSATWLQAGLSGLVLPVANYGFEANSGVPATTYGTASVGVGELGPALTSSAAGGFIVNGRGSSLTPSAAYTHFALLRLTSTDSPWGGIFAAGATDGAATNVTLQRNNASTTEASVYHSTTDATTFPGSLTTLLNGSLHAVAITCDGSSVRKLYIDGAEVTPGASGSAAPTSIAAGRLVLFGERSASATYSSGGYYYCHAVFNRQLDAGTVRWLGQGRNYLDLIASEPRRIYFGAGGGTTDVTVALTGSAVTSSAGTIVSNVAQTLSGTAVTTEAGTVTPVTGVTIALSGSAVTASAGTLSVAISNAITGSEVTTYAGTVTPSTGTFVALSGAAVTTSVGTLSVAVSCALSGSAVTASAGTVTNPGQSI